MMQILIILRTVTEEGAASLLGRVAWGDQKAPVNQSGQRSAEQRADPINQMIVPVGARQRGPKRARGIHRRTGQRPAKENVQRHREPDPQTANSRSPSTDRRA